MTGLEYEQETVAVITLKSPPILEYVGAKASVYVPLCLIQRHEPNSGYKHQDETATVIAADL